MFLNTPVSIAATPLSEHTLNHDAYIMLAKGGVSLSQAVNQVKEETGGKVLTAETITRGGRKQHRIKVLLPNGHVRVMFVNAE